MFERGRLWKRLLAIGIASVFLALVGSGVFAQEAEPPAVGETSALVEEMAEAVMVSDVAFSLDMTWILIAGFLVFFMQAGFAMLEAGFIRQTGVVNSLSENFLDAVVTGVVFFLVGFGIAYGNSVGGLFGSSLFLLDGANGTAGTQEEARLFLDFFYQFAFAAAASTIATGAMAERTNFLGKVIYSAIVAVFIYPVVVHWQWSEDGWLAGMGFLDFAGSTVVHQVGGVLALVGAFLLGARKGVDPRNPPPAHNLGLATLGTFILWFGWYGFNIGSTLDASNPTLMGLTAVNTTLAASAATIAAALFMYLRVGKWDISYMLNGALAGLVSITASCAFVAPGSALMIGLMGGVIVVLAIDAVRAVGIDDAVGAFAVHGACGMFGSLSIGLFGLEALTGSSAGLLMGGGVSLLITQFIGVAAVLVWTTVTAFIMFSAIKAFGVLRISADAEAVGIDSYEHGASTWPDVLPPEAVGLKNGISTSIAQATGD
jgi:ammonium transporter, Amt family